MKIKKIVDLCKANGKLILYKTDKGQWISDGGAAYPLLNLPDFDCESFCRTYDINDKTAEKMVFKTRYEFPTRISFEDWLDEERISTRGKISVFASGVKMIPYVTSAGIAFVDSKYLNPLMDIKDDMLELYERYTEDGNLYFAAKAGLVLVGVIMPINTINKQFVQTIQELSKGCTAALLSKGEDNSQIGLFEMGVEEECP